MNKMKNIMSLILSAAICFSNVSVIVNAEDDETPITEAIEYIIRYDSNELLSGSGGDPGSGGTSVATVEQALENQLTGVSDIQVIDELESDDEQSTKLFSISTGSKEETVSELNNISGVHFAEPNYKIHKLDNDPNFSQQWAINGTNSYGIEADRAWEMTQGNNVLVAVIDTGIDINHRDLAQNIYTNPNETANGSDSDQNGYKDDIHGWDFTTYQNAANNGDSTVFDSAETDKHGTHIAGIIAAASNNYDGKGIAPNAKILPVKILSDDDGTVFNAIKGIEYAEMMGAKIANCSWASEHYSQFLYDTISNSNMLFVCAAGNDGADAQNYPTYPAAYDSDNIISVAATDDQGRLASFSNYGAGVDIGAPGKNIYSTLPENSFGTLDGTSMAAPFVSGASALLLSVADDLTAEEIRSRVLQTSKTLNLLINKVDTNGIVNASDLLLTTVKPTALNGIRYGSETIIVNNEIYSVGGYDGTDYISRIDKFNPITKTWQTAANLPIAVADCAVASYDNKIFVLGGTSGNPINNVQIYNISTNTWTTGASMPKKLCGSAYVQFNDCLYIFGGLGIDGHQCSTYKYNLSLNTWETKTDMPYKASYSSTVCMNDDIYIIGGSNESGVLNGIYLYDAADDVFNYASRLAVSRKDCAAAISDDKIYIFGGSNSFNSQGINKLYEYNNAKGSYIESIIDTVEVYDSNTRICSVTDSMSEPIMGLSAIDYFGAIYLLGGWNGVYSNDVTRYFGAAIPRNINIKTSGNTMKVIWNPVSEATGYNIEIDGTVYESISNSYQITTSDNIEHKIRIQAKMNSQQSLWSDYIYYYLNSTMLDAKQVAVNSTSMDKLYKTGQTKWYKLNNPEAGNLTVSLNNIPVNCNYLVQVCNTSGEVIATGKNSDGIQMINNLVLSPYSYYVKVSSVYGGNDTNAYTLTCSFEASSAATVPDRVRSAFLKPSALDDLSANGELNDLSEYEGEDEPPSEITEESWTETVPEIIDGGCGIQPYIEEEISDNGIENGISLMSLSNYYEETGTLSSVGSTATGNITVPRNSSSYQKYKLVVEVIPEYEYDDMSIEWYGNNTDYENFWWHYTRNGGKYIYYLTANFGRTSSATYQYKIKYDYKSSSSTGNYTVRKYIICDSTSNEDYNNNYCGNETPLYAEYAVPSLNSSITKTGKIDHPYDRDYYYVNASSNEKVTAYLQSPSGKRYDVAIYDNRCTTNNQSESEYMDGWVDESTAYATIKGTTSLSSTKYCIRVGSYDKTFSPDDTYTLVIYKYNISNLGTLEVNNSFDNADSLKTNVASYIGSPTKLADAISFSIDSPVDVDKYAVDMTAGEKISIKMDLPTSYNDSSEKYRIEIYNDVRKSDKVTTYTSRSYNNPDSTRSKYVTFIPETAGTYYIAVRSLAKKYSYSKYGTLTISKTPVSNMDSYENKGEECSNDFAFVTVFSLWGNEFGVNTSTNIQSSINANFDNELDVDWYKFTNGAASKTATISISGNDNMNSAVGIIVLDSNYSLLASGVSGNTYTFAPNETYYIAAYVDDNKYSTIMSNRNYSITVNLSELRSDLVFNPLDWGTFVYDNDPEFLTDDDMADYDLGNRLLMSADGLSGVVDFQSSHSARPYMLEEGNISLDMILYNPTDQQITVEVDRIGYQSPYENNLESGKTDWTTTNWVCLQAWADFLQFNIDKKMFVGDLLENYESYKFKYVQNQLPNGGVYIIEPGQSVWMFGEDTCLTMTHNVWSPFNVVARLKILNGELNIGFAAFRNRAKVYSPDSARLIYDVNTQRSYPSEYAICSHECDCLCDCGCDCGVIYERDCRCKTKSCIHTCVKEHDVNGKPKGTADTVAEVETHTIWNINDSTEYFTPTVYNYANPNGFTIGNGNDFHWVTNFNPNADIYGGYNVGVESDIIPLSFEDKDTDGNTINSWIFDNRHTNPGSGNQLFTGNPPVSNAMPLGNYGVVERYYIDITNTSSSSKNITYKMRTSSHAIVTYKDGNSGWKRKIKLGELYDENNETAEEFEIRKEKSIFSVDINSGETKQLILEVILPNADAGGYQHQLKCE